MSSRVLHCVLLAGAVALATQGAWAQSGTPTKGDTGEGRYQIVRASETRVWRLDTKTGEIAVCTLEGDRLICSTSTGAATPPEKSYEALQEERQQQEQAEAEEQIAFLDRMLEMIRELMAYAIRSKNGEGEGQGAQP